MTSQYLRAGEFVNVPVRYPDGNIVTERVLRSRLNELPGQLRPVPVDLAARIAARKEEARLSPGPSLVPSEALSTEATAIEPLPIGIPDVLFFDASQMAQPAKPTAAEIVQAVARALEFEPAVMMRVQTPESWRGRLIACYLLTVVGGVMPDAAERALQMAEGSARAARRRYSHRLARAGFSFSAGLDAAIALLIRTDRDEDASLDVGHVTWRHCLDAVRRTSDVPLRDILSERRMAPLVRSRQIAYWLMKRFTPLSYSDIGRRMGDRDHTTILHGVRAVEHVASRLTLPEEASPEDWARALWQADWRAGG